MTIDPNKFHEYSALRELDIPPDFCFREWPCPNETKGETCYKAIPFKETVDQLDRKTKDKMVVTSNLICPRPYVDLLARCLYSANREGCPKKMVSPYR
jgi:hypothetical protein